MTKLVIIDRNNKKFVPNSTICTYSSLVQTLEIILKWQHNLFQIHLNIDPILNLTIFECLNRKSQDLTHLGFFVSTFLHYKSQICEQLFSNSDSNENEFFINSEKKLLHK